MPELPDLVYIENKLRPLLAGREIREVALWEPIVIRMGVKGSFGDVLHGKRFRELRRHGPFLVFSLPPLQMIVHFMLAGYFRVDAETANTGRMGRTHCFSFGMDDHTILSYFDAKRMGKIYVIREGDTVEIPGFEELGIDLLSTEFTAQVFRNRLRGRRHQVRVFLMDHGIFSSIGNAYADEILFAAGIHPKTRCTQLSEPQIERLYGSVVSVLHQAIETIERADRGIHVKMREHLQVRNRHGQPCPRCGATIRRTGVLGYDSFFCPKCQPELRSRLVFWDKLP